MVIAGHNIYSVIEQVLITAGVVVVTVVPLIISNRRKNQKLHNRTYEHVNSVEENENVGGKETLGSLVRKLQSETRDGFVRNDAMHEVIGQNLDLLGEIIRSHGGRLDAQRDDIDEILAKLKRRPS